jgi:hypothetical protein
MFDVKPGFIFDRHRGRRADGAAREARRRDDVGGCDEAFAPAGDQPRHREEARRRLRRIFTRGQCQRRRDRGRRRAVGQHHLRGAHRRSDPEQLRLAFQKAKMALYMRAPTRSIVNRWGTPEAALARAPLDLYLVEGGYPVIVEEMMIGALGVGGASGGDEECGHAALERVLGPQAPIVKPVRPSPVGPAAPPAAR